MFKHVWNHVFERYESATAMNGNKNRNFKLITVCAKTNEDENEMS